MKTTAVDSFGTMAADLIMRGAIESLGSRARTLSSAQLDALVVAMRAEARTSLDGALADAKAALDCGMRQAAEATFAASMKLAGIRAAKAALPEVR